ncbi:MAG: helix-turn-helix domain-containing protein [Pseudobacteriovorax sp.]|nr:helix-turn-helix domain-containing protein [Pseudobacteriovorax sp.]
MTKSMIRICLLDYPKAQQSALHGMRELFTVAWKQYKSRQRGRGLNIDILTVEQVLASRQNFAYLIIPPNIEDNYVYAPHSILKEELHKRYQQGTTLVAICAGTFLLAQTGLLNGRPATTHWALAPAFEERYPEVKLDADKIIADEGDLITAGGVMSWIDLSLYLIQRHMDMATVRLVAKLFLIDLTNREQRFYRAFSPSLQHGDDQIIRVQKRMQTQFAEPFSIQDMASIASMSHRTFLRRFQKATGLRPTKYLQQLRIQKACERLESTQDNIYAISLDVGYQDIASFRKTFKSIVGLTPGQYRRRFFVPAEVE